MMVITAQNGDKLREFASQAEGDKNIAIFPESGLSAQEQAAFLKKNADRFTSVITFSPYIISDAAKVKVIDDHEHEIDIRHGSSVNDINLKLWRIETIGDIALDRFQDLEIKLDKANSEREVQNVINTTFKQLGDSIERSFFLQKAASKKITLNPYRVNQHGD